MRGGFVARNEQCVIRRHFPLTPGYVLLVTCYATSRFTLILRMPL